MVKNMPKRGLKALLKRSPGRKGIFRGHVVFRAKESKRVMRGITKRIAQKIHSNGILPDSAIAGDFKGKHWKGRNGGRKRGSAVDAQVTRLVNGTAKTRKGAKLFALTRLIFDAFRFHDLKPVLGQRVLIDESRRIATAADVICQRGSDELVVIELKCGFAGDRTAPAFDPKTRKICKLNSPCAKANDTVLHRHLIQLSTTLALFNKERNTLDGLKRLGITQVSGALLYVNAKGSDLHELQPYWESRGPRLVSAIA